MEAIAINLRYAVRRLLKSPMFTLVAIVSLGLGIGANTAIFSLADAVILRRLPFEDPESLVDIYVNVAGFSHGPLSFPDEEDLARDGRGVFSAVGGSQISLLQTDTDDGVETLPAEAVTGSYFPMTGVHAVVGRLITEEDHVSRGAHRVAVLGWGYWQRRFAGDAGVVGSEIRLAGRPYTIVGVVPRDYVGQIRGFTPDLYVPILQYDELLPGSGVLDGRGNHGFFTKGRLEPGVTLAEAQGVLDRFAASFKQTYPDSWASDYEFNLVPTKDVIVNPMVDRVLLPAAGMVLVVVGLVLLIACANLASFLLARAADRRKEIAVRLALGASRRSLAAQLLTETLLLSLLGGGLGIVIAVWSLHALLSADLPLPFPITLDATLDGRVLVYTLAVSLAAGLFLGLAPAIQGTNPAIAPTLRDETAGGGRGKGTALRNALVVAQVAVCVVLLTGAGLFMRSLNASTGIDVGFGHDPAGMVQLLTPSDRYTDEQARVYYRELEDRIAALPGVRSVGITGNLHLNALNTVNERVQVDAVEPPPGQEYHIIDYTVVDEGFLDAVGLRLLEGRNFDATDVPDGQPVVLVNQAFARKFFPGGEAVGGTVRVHDEDRTVVGVVATAKIRNLAEEPRPFVYGNLHQDFNSFATIVARTTGDEEGTALSMLEAARELDPEIMVFRSETMSRHLAVMLLPRQLGAIVVSLFSALALALACIGLYGLVSFAVARRAHEVGIRLSLGADARQVVWMLTGGGMRLVLIGGALGLVVSALAAQLLGRLLYGVQALDPVTFVGVPLLLAAVAFVASWIPARRASRVDPVTALRSE
jgi:putative ABC transport system permease protein